MSISALGNTTVSSSGTQTNLINISGAGAVSIGAGAQSITISSPIATNFVLNGTSSSVSISAGANIGIGQAASTITVSASNQTSSLSYVAAIGTGAATSTGTIVLAAGANITLNTGVNSITIIGPSPGGAANISLTQNNDIGLVAGTIVSKAGTVTGTAGVGSSLFLQRINFPGQMSISEIDVALSIGFAATDQGAGTMSRSMVIYSFGNSTSLATVASKSSTYAWNTGTSTAGASGSLTQFQGGWSSPLIQPMTFGTSLISPGDYVVGQLFNFAQASSTWTLNFYGVQPASTFLASAATNLTSASLGALSSGGLAAGSGVTGTTALGTQWWPMMISALIGTNSMSAISWSRGSSANTSNSSNIVSNTVFGASSSAQIGFTMNFTNSVSLPITSVGTVAGSIIGTSGSINAVTNVALGALNSSTLAQLGLPNFGFIGTGSTTSGLPTAFMAGIMSTGAVPVAITITSAAVTYSGSAAFQQPWLALAGA